MSRSVLPDVLGVWRSFLRYHRSTVIGLDTELRAVAGMSLDEYDVLVQLSEAPDRSLRMGDLVAATLIARSSCTRVVDHLVERGDVIRGSAPGDGRTVVVTLTAGGRRSLARAARRHLEGVRSVFVDRLDPDEIRQLGALLDKLEHPTTNAR